jgi:hypothetical protein
MKIEQIPIVKTKPYSVARQCLVACQGNRVKAAAMLRLRMVADPKLRDAVFEPYEESAIWDFIRIAALSERTAIIAANMGKDERIEGLQAMAEENARSFLDWPLSCGKFLGDALRVEVEAEAALYRRQARSEIVRARWLDKIAALLPPRKAMSVREVFDNTKLKNLMQQSEQEVRHE